MYLILSSNRPVLKVLNVTTGARKDFMQRQLLVELMQMQTQCQCGASCVWCL